MPTMEENGGLLAIDVGGGTQDILVYTPGQRIENCPKMIMPSPTRVVAGKIAQATNDSKPVFLFGDIMGGGACTRAVKEHITAGLPLYSTEDAALTFHDDPRRVERMGVVLTDTPPPDAVRIRMGDIDREAIARSLENFALQVPARWAVAVQDHGHSPVTSNRRARFGWFREFIESGGQLDRLAFRKAPEPFTRMKAVGNAVPDSIVMDTGPAAILGALLDDTVRERQEGGLIVANVGNYHVMCAMVRGQRILGIFEHHTGQMDSTGLADTIERFRGCDLSNDEVLNTGGHGCYVDRASVSGTSFDFIAVTGPNRDLLHGERFYRAVPYGDMMLTGCFGLVEAARRAGFIED